MMIVSRGSPSHGKGWPMIQLYASARLASFGNRVRECTCQLCTWYIPPEESHIIYRNHRYYPRDASGRKSVLDAVVSCFGERKPHVVSACRGLLDNISEEMSDFLSEVFSCLICDPLTEPPSLETGLSGPTNLEVLIIQSCISQEPSLWDSRTFSFLVHYNPITLPNFLLLFLHAEGLGSGTLVNLESAKALTAS